MQIRTISKIYAIYVYITTSNFCNNGDIKQSQITKKKKNAINFTIQSINVIQVECKLKLIDLIKRYTNIEILLKCTKEREAYRL